MARSKKEYLAFNRGLVDPLALARNDIDRTQLSAETMVNWMPRRLGSMMVRPGTKYLGNTASNNGARYIPFIYSVSDKALVEITDALMRVWVSDALVTRTTPTATIANGTFDSNLNSWTDADAGSAVSQWLTGGYMELLGDGTNYAARYQAISGATANEAIGISVTVERGPVIMMIGTSTDGDEVMSARELGTGTHSFVVTPTTGTNYIRFQNKLVRKVLVDAVAIETTGAMTLVAPWAAADLALLRHDQSADIIYVASGKTTDTIGYQQYKIERWSATEWSCVKYEPEDGPFRPINVTTTTLTPSALTGDVTLTASDNIFESGHVGALFRLSSNGQNVSSAISSQNTFTNTIKVTGAGNARVFQFTISGRTDSTITIQRSVTAEDTGFTDVNSYSADQTATYDDTLDNQTAWYRIGIKTGDYGTDTVTCSLDYPNGSIDGVVRITAVASATSASGIALSALGSTDATTDWYEGEWSAKRGYPSAVTFAEGRLLWGGKSKVWASESDAYETFDDTNTGDSGTFKRTIGSGPVDTVNFLMELESVLVGTDGREHVLRTSNDNEVLTPLNANLKGYGTQGSAKVNAQKMDDTVLYIQRGGQRLLSTTMNELYKYVINDLCVLNPSIGSPKIVRMAIQRQPETRIICIRSDGTAGLLVLDPAEEVSCWINLQIGDGYFEQTFDDIDGIEYQSKSFDVSSEITNLGWAKVGNSGQTMFAIDSSTGVIYQYSLTTAYDVSTATYSGNSFDVTSEDGTPQGFHVKPDGTKMWVVGNTNNTIYEYEMTVGWELTSISYQGNSHDVAADSLETQPQGVWLDDNGTRLYMTGLIDSSAQNTDKVYQYDLDTAWDITSASYVDAISVTAQASGPRDVTLSNDGLVMWVVENASANKIFQYDLSTAWDVTTATYNSVNLDTNSEASNILSMSLDNFSGNIYVGDTGTEFVYQYSFGNPTPIEQAPAIEDVVVLPGDEGSEEDQVYFQISRKVNGSGVRFLEKMSLESECQGGAQNKNLDAHVTGTVADGIMSGLSHLERERVRVWVNGVDAGRYFVENGQVTGVTTDGSAVAGIDYTAQWKSAKLGTLTLEKNIREVAFILRNTHYQGLSFGPNFDELDQMPLVEEGAILADNTIHSTYDESEIPFGGRWDSDSRFCLQGGNGRPCTILAAVLYLEGG